MINLLSAFNLTSWPSYSLRVRIGIPYALCLRTVNVFSEYEQQPYIMKRYLKILVFAGMMTGSVALAISIPSSGSMVGEPGAYQYGDGGEFLVTVDGNPNLQFTTFCIELNNEFAYGDGETYTLGQTDHNNPPGSSPLKLGTAYLFSLFANGGLTGSLTINSSIKAGELQQALWDFQTQGFHFTGPGFDESSNPYYQLAVNNLGSANVLNASGGAYGIEVVQATDPIYGGQDWLVDPPPVPDGGATVLLLGTVFSGIVLLRKKLSA